MNLACATYVKELMPNVRPLVILRDPVGGAESRYLEQRNAPATRCHDAASRNSWAAVTVRRCKLDPSLKVTFFQTLNLRFHTVLST